MNFLSVLKIVGFFAIQFSIILLLPLVVALWYGENEITHFLIPMFGSLGIGGLLLWIGLRNERKKGEQRLGHREGFLIVALFWMLLSVLGAWPLVLSAHLEPMDALFESASALTTTGATVMTGLDTLPKSLLFYRQELQWFGGMGLIVLGVAILPLLGIGGMQLYRAEAPGPLKEEKLTPRLAKTARALWLFYLGLTVACALAYWFAGMDGFDAIAHSLSTVSTGGFSTHDASLGYFESSAIELVAIVFMLLAAINFGVHYIAWSSRDLRAYWRDVEVRGFLIFVVAMITLVSIMLRLEGGYEQLPPSLRDATFEVVSVVTSTGFGTVDFSAWPDFLPVLLIYISFVGGCGGSTAGGMKVMRVQLLIQQGLAEVRRLIHPHAAIPTRIGKRVMDPRLIQGVWGFFGLYITTFALLMLLMIHAGLDTTSAFGAIATTINNMGPGLGEVAYNFQSVSDFGKAVSVASMLLGRLEIFTLLVLLTPEFWQR